MNYAAALTCINRTLQRGVACKSRHRAIVITLMLGMTTGSFLSCSAYADETNPLITQANQTTQTRKIEINEADTQLAQRMAVREAQPPRFEYALGTAYRQDNLKWSIADATVNVASKVQWKNSVIAQLRADAKLHLNADWQLRAAISTGAVRSGTNQDSDYAASNYTQEYSRSNNQSGGAVRDFSIAVGKTLPLPDLKVKQVSYPLHIIPLAGFAINQQSFTMLNGQQTLPANGAFPNLHNSYDTQWKSIWFGAEGLLKVNDQLTLTGTGEYHFADYTAEANWNLRNDFAHPVSFKHTASGQGYVISAGMIYQINKNILLNSSLGYQSWHTGSGVDQTFFAGGTTNNYTLNSVWWNAWTLHVGGAYRF